MYRPLWGTTRSHGHRISGMSFRRFSASNHLLMHTIRRTCSRNIAHLQTETSPALPRKSLLAAPLSFQPFQFHTSCRHWSWFPKFNQKSNEHYNEPSDLQEEAAKAAILEKAMKGRQPADLLLRCEFSFPPIPSPTHVH